MIKKNFMSLKCIFDLINYDHKNVFLCIENELRITIHADFDGDEQYEDEDFPTILWKDEIGKFWLQNGKIRGNFFAMWNIEEKIHNCLKYDYESREYLIIRKLVWNDKNNQPAIKWYQNNRLHRNNDEPSIIIADGTKKWYKNGFLDRDNNLPAIIEPNGQVKWFIKNIEQKEGELDAFNIKG